MYNEKMSQVQNKLKKQHKENDFMRRLISSQILKSIIITLPIVLASMSLTQAVTVGDRIPELNISQ
jgi:hypothetical protein